LAERYAQEHGLDLDAKLTFADLGVSAFSGANLADNSARFSPLWSRNS